MPATTRRYHDRSPLPAAVEAPGPVAEAIRLWWAAWRDWRLKDEVHERLCKDGDPAASAALAALLDAHRWEQDRWWTLCSLVTPALVAYRFGDIVFGYTAADRSGLSARAVVGGLVVRQSS